VRQVRRIIFEAKNEGVRGKVWTQSGHREAFLSLFAALGGLAGASNRHAECLIGFA